MFVSKSRLQFIFEILTIQTLNNPLFFLNPRFVAIPHQTLDIEPNDLVELLICVQVLKEVLLYRFISTF